MFEVLLGITVFIQCFSAHLAFSRGLSPSKVLLILLLLGVGPLAYFCALLFQSTPFKRILKRVEQYFTTSSNRLEKVRASVRFSPTIENHHLLATLYRETGHYHKALCVIESVLRQPFENCPLLLLEKAHILFSLERSFEAQSIVLKLKKSEPRFESFAVDLLHARILSEQGEWKTATYLFEHLERVSHDLEASYYFLQHLHKMCDFSRAEEILDTMERRLSRLPRHFKQAQRTWVKQAQNY